MKKSFKIFAYCLLLMIVSISLFSFVSHQQPKSWSVPAEYKNKPNPVKSSATSINEGKELYMKQCAACHGKTGFGDGPKSKTLESSAGDFTSKGFQSQSDGELFYKTWKGRDEMPAFKGKATDDEIWYMIIFMRTFKN